MFPANEQLYAGIVKQAKAHWPPRNPMNDKLPPAANEWISKTYTSEGGTYVASKSQANPALLDKDREAAKAAKAKKKKKENRKKALGLL